MLFLKSWIKDELKGDRDLNSIYLLHPDLKLSDLLCLNVPMCPCHPRKQDGSDSRISATLEPQLFQSTLPYSAAPFHKVCWGTEIVARSLTPDLIPGTSVWPFFAGRLFDVAAHLVSTPASLLMRSFSVLHHHLLLPPHNSFFIVFCFFPFLTGPNRACKALYRWSYCSPSSIIANLYLAGNRWLVASSLSIHV